MPIVLDGGGTVTITSTDGGDTFNFTSTVAVDAVIVTNGLISNVYLDANAVAGIGLTYPENSLLPALRYVSSSGGTSSGGTSSGGSSGQTW